ncbi:hypothetical protein ACSBR1_003069 [Camellia fascicularis]
MAEDIKTNSMSVAKYTIVNPNDPHPFPESHKITVRVTYAHRNSYHYAELVESGQFSFQAAEHEAKSSVLLNGSGNLLNGYEGRTRKEREREREEEEEEEEEKEEEEYTTSGYDEEEEKEERERRKSYPNANNKRSVSIHLILMQFLQQS